VPRAKRETREKRGLLVAPVRKVIREKWALLAPLVHLALRDYRVKLALKGQQVVLALKATRVIPGLLVVLVKRAIKETRERPELQALQALLARKANKALLVLRELKDFREKWGLVVALGLRALRVILVLLARKEVLAQQEQQVALGRKAIEENKETQPLFLVFILVLISMRQMNLYIFYRLWMGCPGTR
jgi:hypothetical protein